MEAFLKSLEGLSAEQKVPILTSLLLQADSVSVNNQVTNLVKAQYKKGMNIKIVQEACRIISIVYTDEKSVKNCSYNDLELGYENCMVGCGGKSTLGASTTKKGDIVIIKANKGARKYMSIGVLDTRLENCKLWYEEGGIEWDYNYKYTPITQIFEITPSFCEKVYELGKKHNCNAKNFFNSRFCSIKLKPILLDLLKEGVI
jgi:hypothetical protein